MIKPVIGGGHKGNEILLAARKKIIMAVVHFKQLSDFPAWYNMPGTENKDPLVLSRLEPTNGLLRRKYTLL